MYEAGEGVAQSLTHAYMWMDLASKLADGPEQENYEMNRDQIEVRLSSEDLVKAKGMSDRCLETRYAECD